MTTPADQKQLGMFLHRFLTEPNGYATIWCKKSGKIQPSE